MDPMSSVPKKADKLNISLSLSLSMSPYGSTRPQWVNWNLYQITKLSTEGSTYIMYEICHE